ncbi:MAG: N-acetylmuramoyl-L-alanine amidase [Lachnospiraceae bacterium]
MTTKVYFMTNSELENIAKVIYAEGSVFCGKNYLALLAIAQCIYDLYNTEEYQSLDDCLSRCFTAPSDVLNDECLEIAKEVFEHGKKRLQYAKIYQFRSYSKYSDGNGNLDTSKVQNLLKNYDYLGSDFISNEWGHFYFGKKGDGEMNIIETYVNNNTNNYTVANRGKGDITWIVIHYTANPSSTAAANAQYYASGNTNGVSAHYFVDETGIYRGVREKDIAGHCGAYVGASYLTECRNANSIGIEMCCYSASGMKASQLTGNERDLYFADKTVTNTIDLVKDIMARYNIPVDNVIRHYDVHSGRKMCPRPYVGDDVNTYYKKTGNQLWKEFKSKITSSTTTTTKTAYSVPQIATVNSGDGLNLRSSASSSNNSNLIVTLPNGLYVNIIENGTNGWCKVQTVLENKNYIGYVYSAYLKPVTKKCIGRTVTDPTGLNIRAINSVNGTLVATMGKGFGFYVLETMNNGWGFIQCGNTIGYCSLNNSYSKAN